MTDDTPAPLGEARFVDATGLTCPQPVHELAAAIEEVATGARVVLASSDPTSRVDVPVWCRLRRHRLHRVEDRGDAWWFHVERR